MTPTPQADIEEMPMEDDSPDIQPSPSQLGFELGDRKTQAKQLYSGVKTMLKKRRDIVDVSQIWKSAALPFAIVTSITNILILFIGGIFNFERFGPQIRIFYDAINQVPVTVDKVFIFIIPILLTGFFIVQLKLISYIFPKDKNLALTIAWTITFLNFLLLISIDQIYSLALA